MYVELETSVLAVTKLSFQGRKSLVQLTQYNVVSGNNKLFRNTEKRLLNCIKNTN